MRLLILPVLIFSASWSAAAVRVSSPAEAKRGVNGLRFSVTHRMSRPESAYYDEGSRSVYVSNVAGDPSEKDGQGWISRLTPSGNVTSSFWVMGLNAPKGMRSRDGKLYVTDIDVLLTVDIAEGKVVRSIPFPEAEFLNDVAIAPDGALYVSDTAASRIYRVGADGKPEVFAEGKEYDAPNGLFVRDGRLYVAPQGLKKAARLYYIDLETGKMKKVSRKRLGRLDGLELLPDGRWLVSDFDGGRVFAVDEESRKAELLYEGFKGAADIGTIPGKDLLLVPRMLEDAVEAYEIPKAEE